jgi:hypothetical protein
MPAILPADSFCSFPRAPRAQFFADKVHTQAHAMTLIEGIIEQRKSSALFQPVVDLNSSNFRVSAIVSSSV